MLKELAVVAALAMPACASVVSMQDRYILLGVGIDWPSSEFQSVSDSGVLTVVANDSKPSDPEQLEIYFSGVCPSYDGNQYGSARATVNGILFSANCPILYPQNQAVYIPVEWGVPISISYSMQAQERNTASTVRVEIYASDRNTVTGSVKLVDAIGEPVSMSDAVSANVFGVAIPEPGTWLGVGAALVGICLRRRYKV